MIYVKATLSDGSDYIVEPRDAHQIVQDIASALEDNNIQETWKVEFVEMTEAEYNDLPDFEES